MKFTLDWLKEFVSIRWSPEELAHRLTMAGLEVESVEVSGDDRIFTLGITPNRSDCLSLVGIAREVSALQGKSFIHKPVASLKGAGSIKDFVQVKVHDTKGCPRYMARVVRGLRVAPSPAWMQARLTKVGLRPVNNVVDCTNYVLWELGHPLHAFDRRFLRGNQIVVRQEKGATRFVSLDGVERTCQPGDLFICDSEGPVALAGVMGGKNSEVRNDTQEIVIEAAAFDPKTIHRTSKRLGLSSESSYRFERGVDPNGVADALQRVTQLIVETSGGTPSADWVDVYSKKIKPHQINLPLSEIKRQLGIDLSAKEVSQIFNLLGFSSKKTAKGLTVHVPTFRSDISKTIDLVEEVARLKGYGHIPATLPAIRTNLPVRPKQNQFQKQALDCLAAQGYSEACHLSFTSLNKARIFEPNAEAIVPLSNPLSEEHAVLRPSLLPGLLDALAFNLNRQCPDVKLFELKKIFSMKESRVVESKRLAVVASGREWGVQWQLKTKPVDFYSLKGLLSQLAKQFHLKPFDFSLKEVPPFLVSSASSTLLCQGKKVGWGGLLNPGLLKNWEIEGDVYAFEIDWSFLAEEAGKVALRCKPISKYPYIERDIALIVDNHLPAQKIEETIRGFSNPWIQKIQLFDLFKGGSLPAGKKSLALNIRYALSERTLTNEEVNETHLKLITRLESELGAQLRK